jgi:hypothetical protein
MNPEPAFRKMGESSVIYWYLELEPLTAPQLNKLRSFPFGNI